jgi:hypothetical protein
MKNKFFFLFFLVLGTGVAFSQKAYFADILEAANAGYFQYLEKIPVGKESDFGLKNRAEFALAKIGKPYQIFLPDKTFFSDSILTDMTYLVPANEWRVSLLVNGECRVMITVAKVNDLWKVVGIGAAGLANELREFEKENPSGYQYGMILRILPLDCEFLLNPSDTSFSTLKTYFLNSAHIAFDLSPDFEPSYSLQELLSFVKNKIENK